MGHARHPYTQRLIAAIPHGTPPEKQDGEAAPFVLQAEGMRKTYVSGGGLFSRARRVDAVRDVNFTIRRGETLGLVGESGSGKSTVGRCIAGLLKLDSGRILFKGQDTTSADGAGKRSAVGRIQMVFQDPHASLNPRHKVGTSIMSGPIAQGVPRSEALKRMADLLTLVGLNQDAAERYPHEFSGGQRQRIGIARALAVQPDLIVADEPVSALDVSVQQQVLELFATVRVRYNLAMLFVTHDLRVAAQMCDHIAVMQQGSIIEYGTAQAVVQQPTHPYTRKLIEAVPDFATIVSGRRKTEAQAA